jgi:hypothetical protein
VHDVVAAEAVRDVAAIGAVKDVVALGSAGIESPVSASTQVAERRMRGSRASTDKEGRSFSDRVLSSCFLVFVDRAFSSFSFWVARSLIAVNPPV